MQPCASYASFASSSASPAAVARCRPRVARVVGAALRQIRRDAWADLGELVADVAASGDAETLCFLTGRTGIYEARRFLHERNAHADASKSSAIGGGR
jgi:hypothetical protein